MPAKEGALYVCFRRDRTLCFKKASETAADQAGLVGKPQNPLPFFIVLFQIIIKQNSTKNTLPARDSMLTKRQGAFPLPVLMKYRFCVPVRFCMLDLLESVDQSFTRSSAHSFIEIANGTIDFIVVYIFFCCSRRLAVAEYGLVTLSLSATLDHRTYASFFI